ncbi:metallophosphoesterase family protein [Candidatus Formimonas warabiya]|uniref:Phosphoesterase n=1 Tax=Formimonas warabiya TaxID=1761012 RepID=A0A3G1L1D9_FORW1|nr:metallophosphoesterase [Candidatus Formimonas warabiya]ATW28295.1 YfcE family phosphodiesterase [Candidatus Formimonas warabiya]
MKIGVISDTHMPRRGKSLPPVLWEVFQEVDLILHAGDVVEAGVLLDLETIAPVEAVAGNMDSGELAFRLPRKKILHVGGKRIGLVHGDGSSSTTLGRAILAFAQDQPDCIVFGHSHQPFNQVMNGVLMFNPGSCTDPRREPRPSCGLLHVKEGEIRGEIIYFERA